MQIPQTPEHIRRNRERWDAFADEYQATNAPQISGQMRTGDIAWGVWGIPESEMRILGDVEGRVEEQDGMVSFQLPIGEWIRLLRDHGFAIERLIEPQPAPGATSTYRDETDREWSRRWPSECVWVARREG